MQIFPYKWDDTSTFALLFSDTCVIIFCMDKMTGIPLGVKYGHLAAALAQSASTSSKIDASNVYQEANPKARAIMNTMVSENLLPGSGLEAKSHFIDFFDRVKAGEHGLILMEHYSSVDMPILCYLLDKDLADNEAHMSSHIVTIANMKLNEENRMVKAWAEGFSRIVIYPSRKMASDSDEEIARGRKINMAAMRALDQCRKQGRVVLVHPTGTRYRPGKPETRRGLREIDSYLRMFDIMILVTINGACLHLTPEDPDNMLADLVIPDVVMVTASPVIDCNQYRKEVAAANQDNPDADLKQESADRIMGDLEAQHEKMESYRCSLQS
jgi:glycerol-3-phosphate O-acyltransferase